MSAGRFDSVGLIGRFGSAWLVAGWSARSHARARSLARGRLHVGSFGLHERLHKANNAEQGSLNAEQGSLILDFSGKSQIGGSSQFDC